MKMRLENTADETKITKRVLGTIGPQSSKNVCSVFEFWIIIIYILFKLKI